MASELPDQKGSTSAGGHDKLLAEIDKRLTHHCEQLMNHMDERLSAHGRSSWFGQVHGQRSAHKKLSALGQRRNSIHSRLSQLGPRPSCDEWLSTHGELSRHGPIPAMHEQISAHGKLSGQRPKPELEQPWTPISTEQPWTPISTLRSVDKLQTAVKEKGSNATKRSSFRTTEINKQATLRKVSDLDSEIAGEDVPGRAVSRYHSPVVKDMIIRLEGHGCVWRIDALRFIYSAWCELFLGVLIVCNTVILGVEVDYLARNMKTDPPFALEVVTLAFNAIFSLEVTLRLLAGSRSFFFSSAWGFNFLDVVVCAISIVEATFYFTTTENGDISSVTLIRIVRIMRMTRILRLVRLPRFFRSLRVVVASVLNTVRSLFWTLVVLLCILFIFAVLFTQAVTQYFIERCQVHKACPSDWGDLGAEVIFLHRHFGNLIETIFTLFKAITGGINWSEISDALDLAGTSWVILFAFFIAFAYLAVLNIITGVVCTTAIESANTDQDMVVQAHLARKEKYVTDLEEVFYRIDQNNTGSITFREFEEVMKDPENERSQPWKRSLEKAQLDIQTVFDAMDITTDTAWHLFRLLDCDETHRIDLSTFVEGCLRLQGTAKTMDLKMLTYESQWTMKKVDDIINYLEELDEKLEELPVRQHTEAPYSVETKFEELPVRQLHTEAPYSI